MTGLSVVSPFSGWLTSLDMVPDPVFAERMLGDGVAVDPLDGVVRAPVRGRVKSIHAARHAVTVESDEGAVLLIHVGLETVTLGGAGFRVKVSEGARVEVGDPLLVIDLDAVGRAARSLITPIILTNGDAFAIEPGPLDREVAAGDPIFMLRPLEGRAQGTDTEGASTERRLALPLRHGLHARPAARIAEMARGFDARIDLVAEDGRSASAVSPVAMLALALPHGASFSIRARGAQAVEAVEALAELIGGGMGEGAPLEAKVAMPAPVAGPLPSVLHGVSASPGLVAGPAFRLSAVAMQVPETGQGAAEEHVALADAIEAVRGELARASDGRGAAAAIAEAHLAFLDDPELRGAAERAIVAGRSAGAAWKQAIGGFAGLLGASRDRRFAERLDDLRDLEGRVLAALYGAPKTEPVPAGAIFVADDLLPSQLMAIADSGIGGIATGKGGPTSHVAIIAASMGLPMLVALGGDVERIRAGMPLLLDAGAGTLAIDPPAERIAEMRGAAEAAARFRTEAQAHAHEPALTTDGTRIEVFANLGSLADAERASEGGAEGCGLLRTEFLFLDRPTPPDEEEQRATYQSIAAALGGRPLIIRTLDIGADKPAPYLPLAVEENPALGLRGLRVGFARPDLLEAQLRALVQTDGDVRIMLPMVVEPSEVARVRSMLDRVATEAGRSAPPLGIMVETPAAAMMAEPLAHVADFFSIGSNDLTQYALAMDRGNPAVAARLDGLHPAVLRLIAATVSGGKAGGRWTGVCGGVAADPLAVPVLIGLGVTELSVPPAAVAEIKAHVRGVGLAACEALAAQALAAKDAAEVRALVRRFIGEGEGA